MLLSAEVQVQGNSCTSRCHAKHCGCVSWLAARVACRAGLISCRLVAGGGAGLFPRPVTAGCVRVNESNEKTLDSETNIYTQVRPRWSSYMDARQSGTEEGKLRIDRGVLSRTVE